MHRCRGHRRVVSLVVGAALAACAGRKPVPEPAPTPSVEATPPTAAVPAAAQPAVVAGTGVDASNPSITLPKPQKVRSDRQLLTRDAILGTQYTNLYDVILALRGNWLRTRAAESIQGKSSTLQVYLDNQRLSGADELRAIAPTNVASVRYFDPIQASSRWGMDHGAGAIYILTAKP